MIQAQLPNFRPKSGHFARLNLPNEPKPSRATFCSSPRWSSTRPHSCMPFSSCTSTAFPSRTRLVCICKLANYPGHGPILSSCTQHSTRWSQQTAPGLHAPAPTSVFRTAGPWPALLAAPTLHWQQQHICLTDHAPSKPHAVSLIKWLKVSTLLHKVCSPTAPRAPCCLSPCKAMQVGFVSSNGWHY